MFFWRSTVPPRAPGLPAVELAVTGRGAGRGAAPFTGLNLGGHVGDDPVTVEQNRHEVASAMGVDRDHLLFLAQVHGDTVAHATGPWSGDAPEADAAVTATPGLALAALVADCVPVLLHDADAGVVAAVHAGRPGLLAGVVDRAVDALAERGARHLSAVVGPSVCGRCYEVPEAMARDVAHVAPSALARSWAGTPAVDVAAGVVERLSARRVVVQWLPGCTREDGDLYSYRRDGRTGRFAAVVALREVAA
ncbi:hypothetical protein DFJ68_0598 [Terracoccus luteus]|uniref:Purine nucleoside phosphorylase n=1 Tax=Terracoccus luteus TaxID=53356 RepID=A0A495XTD0_9MICO|nr:peptidoglycan editing factor PgeF [Terracoccus luteus]RKT77182.1 hypothetical protein DFJ68_0598 [Terracoccus luteus]